MKKQQGFTLIELLVIVGVLAFLMTISLLTFNRVRSQSRDSMRVVHMTQLQTALRGYYRDNLIYPTQLMTGQAISTSSTTYIEAVPSNPQPVDGGCPSTKDYAYTRDAGGASYHIVFCLGNNTADYIKGTNIVTPAGISK